MKVYLFLFIAFLIQKSQEFNILNDDIFSFKWQSTNNIYTDQELSQLEPVPLSQINQKLHKGRILFGVPVTIKSVFTGQYQSPVMRLELGENYLNLKNNKDYQVSEKGKVTVKQVKVKDVFIIKKPMVKIRGKARGDRLRKIII